MLGEVTTPGQYPYIVNLTAETAVAIAGGFAPRAYKQTVQLIRKVGGTQVRSEVPPDHLVRPGESPHRQESGRGQRAFPTRVNASRWRSVRPRWACEDGRSQSRRARRHSRKAHLR
ncbi:MAG TPA: SLBB domain-containing protein [Pseudolabrys sp.]|nr:SLBB domain-containing protein [Pseudolabrys sp.]